MQQRLRENIDKHVLRAVSSWGSMSASEPLAPEDTERSARSLQLASRGSSPDVLTSKLRGEHEAGGPDGGASADTVPMLAGAGARSNGVPTLT